MRNLRNSKNSTGFTLLELMIVVAIVGVISAVAYPSYLDTVRKAKRADGVKSVLECASILERRFTIKRTYTDDACASLVVDDYAITVAVTGLTRTGRACVANSKNNCYLITATNTKSDPDCKTFTLNELGVKTAKKADNSDNTEVCWRRS